MRKECTESTSTCSSSCSLQRGPSERAGSLSRSRSLSRSLSLSLSLSLSPSLPLSGSLAVIHLTPFRPPPPPPRRKPFSWLFRSFPYLAAFNQHYRTEEHRTGRRSVRTRWISIHSFPRARSLSSLSFFFLRSPRCSLELSNGKLTGGAPAGSGSGSSTGEGEGVHLRHRFDVACISRRRRRRLAQKVRWRPERAITCFDIKPAGCGRRRSRSVAAAVGKATDSDRAAHEL